MNFSGHLWNFIYSIFLRIFPPSARCFHNEVDFLKQKVDELSNQNKMLLDNIKDMHAVEEKLYTEIVIVQKTIDEVSKNIVEINKCIIDLEKNNQDQLHDNIETLQFEHAALKRKMEEVQGSVKLLSWGNFSLSSPKETNAYFSSISKSRYPEELAKWYYQTTGKVLSLSNPKTFNEKIQWLKLYDNSPQKTKLSDKYLVREWVLDKISEEHVVPLLGVWESFDEIDFDGLPQSFILKANHGSNWFIIVKDKETLDFADAKRRFDEWLEINYAYYGLELQYSNIHPRILAEKYIEDIPCEYKYWCFNGEPKFLACIRDPKGKNEKLLYSLDFEKLDFVNSPPIANKEFNRPIFLQEMNEAARRLCAEFPFVRVDFLSDGENFYFGEMTFSPSDGRVKWLPQKYDQICGEWLALPEREQ